MYREARGDRAWPGTRRRASDFQIGFGEVFHSVHSGNGDPECMYFPWGSDEIASETCRGTHENGESSENVYPMAGERERKADWLRGCLFDRSFVC